MSEANDGPLACLDANVFLAALIPEATKAPKDEILGSARVLRALEEGRLRCVSTAILLGEVRYVYLREDKAGFEIARAAIEAETGMRLLSVTASLAIHAAELRRKYSFEEERFFLQRCPLSSDGISGTRRAADYHRPTSLERCRTEDVTAKPVPLKAVSKRNSTIRESPR